MIPATTDKLCHRRQHQGRDSVIWIPECLHTTGMIFILVTASRANFNEEYFLENVRYDKTWQSAQLLESLKCRNTCRGF